MSRVIRALVMVVLLGTIVAPVRAQGETAVCLQVETIGEVDLTDALSIQEGIRDGSVLVTDVVPCAADPAPVDSAPPVAGTGAWQVLSDVTDSVTGDRRVTVILDAASGLTSRGRPIRLSIACADGWVVVAVDWGWNLGPGPHTDVQIRVGDGEVAVDPWHVKGEITNHGGSGIPFVKSLYGESRLALSVPTRDAGQLSATFDITGIEEAVAGMREVCPGW